MNHVCRCQAHDGTLVVGFCRTANYNDQGRYDPKLGKLEDTRFGLSRDGGKTWSESVEIPVAEFGWASPFGKIGPWAPFPAWRVQEVPAAAKGPGSRVVAGGRPEQSVVSIRHSECAEHFGMLRVLRYHSGH